MTTRFDMVPSVGAGDVISLTGPNGVDRATLSTTAAGSLSFDAGLFDTFVRGSAA